ncbi:probable two-component sensor, putative [Microscilla marina ATCC 23134]|uniref:Probable two-component sensor, putative n=2 Tax=Microscilla marina TaxID=1027 RepID=A1ZM27_MICM2|nr:probable two-component sensor, putative [Microscilla marina ATCC 23134]
MLNSSRWLFQLINHLSLAIFLCVDSTILTKRHPVFTMRYDKNFIQLKSVSHSTCALLTTTYTIRKIMKQHFLLLLLFVSCGDVQAQLRLSLNPAQNQYTLSQHIGIFADSTGTYSLQDLLAGKAHFTINTNPQPNFGLTNTTYWVRLNLYNPDDKPVQWMIENGYPITHYIDLFVVDQNQQVIFKAKGGSKYPFEQRLVKYRKNVFPTLIPAHTQYTYFFRLQSQTSMQILLTAWQPVAFAENTNNELYFWGGYVGIILAVILYNMFVAMSLKSISYAYYIVYVGCFGLIQLSLQGLAYQYLWPNAVWWTNHCMPFLMLLSTFASVAFTQGFLLTQTSQAKWLHKVLNIAKYANLSFVVILLLPYQIALKISALISVISLILMLAAGVIRLLENYRPARYFCIAWFTFVLGAIILILKNFGVLPTNFFTSHTAAIGSALEAILLSVALADKLKVLTQERDEAHRETLKVQKQINEDLEDKVKLRTREIAEKNAELITQNEEITAQRDLLDEQKTAIEDQHIQITSSINYAQKIQQAMLPDIQEIKENFADCFVLYKPRDTVSGDFYWFTRVETHQRQPLLILAAADCTGHGVPGGFMSMIGNELLTEIVYQRKEYQPDLILQELDLGIRRVLKQKETGNRDGMDLTIVTVDPHTQTMRFSGAQNPLVYVQNSEMRVIKGDKIPVGGARLKKEHRYTCHTIDIASPTTLYMYSDGYQDQFGGAEGRKFMSRRFRELLYSIHQKPMLQQQQILEQQLADWQQHQHKQVDDILITGVRV